VPHFKIERSLYEPVTIEVEGGRVFESVPISTRLLKEITRLDEQVKGQALDAETALIRQVSLLFGVDEKELENIDFRVLSRILEHANAAVSRDKSAEPAGDQPVEKKEVEVEKNVSEPGGEISQS
jgi:hypothetical protein